MLRRSKPDVSGGLAPRTVLAGSLLLLLVGGAFAVLLLTISNLRAAERRVTSSREATAAAANLEERVIDLETGVRGFIITRQERFLQPWIAARASILGNAKALELVVDDPEQKRRVREITRDITGYITDYSVPLVNAARRNDPEVRSVARMDEGKQRVDALRLLFRRFRSTEQVVLTEHLRRDEANANRAVYAATIGLAGSAALIVAFVGYLIWAIVRPLRRASRLAGELAAGDLGARMSETSTGEIGFLERSFNRMAASLEQDREHLRRLADEQAALRRVATLVAREVPPAQVFSAVTREVGLSSRADLARLERYEADGTVSGIAAWSRDAEQLAVGTRFELEGPSIAALVLQQRRPVRVDSFVEASGPIALEARELGIRSSVGCPIIVAGQLWGVIAASSRSDVPFPAETELQMAQFTELVATAIANAENQNELRASRARIVAASDLTRRQIERDLHDGVQQRLVSVALELRSASTMVPAGLDAVEVELANVASGIVGVLDDLREISRGIHPAILAEGGLGPVLKTLARRSPIPVELDARLTARLQERVEVAVYYFVSEALTNAAKHSQATVVHVEVQLRDGALHVAVRDDGIGGADETGGSGIVGLRDRVEALGGALSVRSPRREGTVLEIELPL